MKFNMYYIWNTLGYEAMIHHLFFLWIIKTNCDCAHLNWKKAKSSLLECKMLEVAPTTSIFVSFWWSNFYHAQFKLDKISVKKGKTRHVSYYWALPFSQRQHHHYFHQCYTNLKLSSAIGSQSIGVYEKAKNICLKGNLCTKAKETLKMTDTKGTIYKPLLHLILWGAHHIMYRLIWVNTVLDIASETPLVITWSAILLSVDVETRGLSCIYIFSLFLAFNMSSPGIQTIRVMFFSSHWSILRERTAV